MLGPVWLWWRLASALVVAACLFFGVSVVSVAYLFAVVKAQVADGLPFVFFVASAVFGGLFVVAAMTLSEALREGETEFVRLRHLLWALCPLGIVISLHYILNQFITGSTHVLTFALAPVCTMRTQPFNEHPLAKARVFFKLWRYPDPITEFMDPPSPR